MEEYLKLYPNESENVLVGLYAFGLVELNLICEEAIKKNKKVIFENDEKKIDLTVYKFTYTK